jgi:hypothetical protein
MKAWNLVRRFATTSFKRKFNQFPLEAAELFVQLLFGNDFAVHCREKEGQIDAHHYQSGA